MKELNEEEKKVILNKGTEAPFSGKYNDFYEKGIYQCKQCGASLYKCRRKNKISIWKNKTSIKVEILFFYKP